jgi:hypothetical protein
MENNNPDHLRPLELKTVAQNEKYFEGFLKGST